jgi:TRAP-type C4-dicarboxylate transport system substrate-binding protein
MFKSLTCGAFLASMMVGGVAVAETYQVAHFTPESTPMGHYGKIFGEKLAAATDGKIELQFFWAGSLDAGSEIVPLVGAGAVPLGVTAPAYYPSEMPITGMLNSLPMTFKGVAAAMSAQQELSTNEDFMAEYEQVGVFPIYQHGLSTLHLICTQPVASMADMKGLKVRSFGYFLPLAFSSLGMVPVTLPLQDTYEGLDRGVVDCVPMNYASAHAYKLQEVAPYWSDVNLGAFSGPAMYVNYDLFFNTWDEATRQTVTEVSAEVFAMEAQELDLADAEALESAKGEGVTAVAFSEQAEMDGQMIDMIDAWQTQQVDNGMSEELASRVAQAVREKTPE